MNSSMSASVVDCIRGSKTSRAEDYENRFISEGVIKNKKKHHST